jgi:hypothetical protein
MISNNTTVSPAPLYVKKKLKTSGTIMNNKPSNPICPIENTVRRTDNGCRPCAGVTLISTDH